MRDGQVEPIQLIAGGSGIAPLMAMIRSRGGSERGTFSVLFGPRSGHGVVPRRIAGARRGRHRHHLRLHAHRSSRLSRLSGRIDATLLAEAGWASTLSPTCYLCGPTSFVEHVAELLVNAGHDPGRIRTERFGPTGTQR